MMVSYRKKYSPQVESPPRDNDDAPVVASPRPSAAAPPATAVDHPEPPVLEERPPEEVAAKNAIQERLREMTEAEAHARQPVEQRAAESSSRQTPEEFIDHLDVPETTKKWLKRHPEVVTDSALGQEVRALHNTARRRAGGEEFSENYFRAMDDLLGFEPAGNGRRVLPRQSPEKEKERNRAAFCFFWFGWLGPVHTGGGPRRRGGHGFESQTR